VYVSHSIEEVTRLVDWLVVMSTGRIAAADDLADVMGLLGLQPLTGRYKAGAVIEARIASHDLQFELTRLNFAGGDCASRSCKCPWGNGAPTSGRVSQWVFKRPQV
jgi:molybdate transport system ATP-binding protein